MLVPSSSSIVVVSSTCCPSPLSCPPSIHCHRAPLFITVDSSSRRPSPSSLRSRRPSPTDTVEELLCRPLPPFCRRAVHRRHATSSIATIAIKLSPLRRPSPSSLPLPSRLPSPPCLPLPPTPSMPRHGRAFRRRCTVQRVPSPSRHPLPSPLRRRCAPFLLSLQVDCCLLPLLHCRRAFHCRCHRRRCVTVASSRVRRSSSPSSSSSSSRPHTPPCLPSPPPALVDCHISVDSRELYMLK